MLKKFLLVFLATTLLASCTHFRPRKLEIQQGNVISKAEAAKLHPGMSKDEVIVLLGNPILINTFDENRLDYIYSIKPGYGTLKRERLTVYFKDNKVTHIKSDLNAETKTPIKDF